MLEKNVEEIILYLKSELAKVRAGRVSIDLVTDIKVEAYGTQMPLNQLATLATPEPRMITIQPWDKSLIKNIESALRQNLTYVNPVVDSEIIRIAFPMPTEERRGQLIKDVGKIIEQARIKLRRAREEELRGIKNEEDRKEISEDELFRKKEKAQKTIDEYNKQIEKLGKNKEEEILTL